MATAHLICGLPCSGKSTCAVDLHNGTHSILFTLDRWLITMFGRYAIEDVGHDEHVRRVIACRELMWDVARQALALDVDVIFDDGFFWREHRHQAIQRSRDLGAGATIHFLNPSRAVLEARIDARNAALPSFNFRIDRSMLDLFYAQFQTPTRDEAADLITAADGTHGENRYGS